MLEFSTFSNLENNINHQIKYKTANVKNAIHKLTQGKYSPQNIAKFHQINKIPKTFHKTKFFESFLTKFEFKKGIK